MLEHQSSAETGIGIRDEKMAPTELATDNVNELGMKYM